MAEVKLYGMWASPFCWRVEWALKLKGIPYQYIEVDLENKSNELLQYNPIHKKVPVLLHQGRPIAESLVILEYIEETWKQSPLLPSDPYLRSRIRLWADFFESTLLKSAGPCIRAGGEEQKRAFEMLLNNLSILEKGLEEDFSGGCPFLQGEKVGILDIVVGSMLVGHRATEEAVGVVIMDPQRFPSLVKWLEVLKKDPTVNDFLPPHEKLLERVLYNRSKVVGSAHGT